MEVRLCVSICVCVCVCTSKEREPLQAYLDHLDRFLGFVQGDGLSALLLNVDLQVVLQVTADT